MKGLCISVILVAIGLPFAKPATAETVSVSNDPIELVRTLRTVQDKIVQGSREAYASQRKLIAAVTDQLLSAKPEVWRDVKYLRAGIVFTLNGGDTRVARNVLGLGDLPAMEERILKGALAYAEGRTTEASEQLSGIDALSLDSSIASHVALAQGVILGRDEPQRAVSRLEIARLLAPGTLVEEAALRREIMLVSALEDFDRFETLTARYMRRYSRSIYAVGFHRQLAAEIANSKNWDDPQRLARLDSMLEGLDASDKRDVYLAMAQAGILKGQVGLTRFAAHHANSLGGDAAAAIWPVLVGNTDVAPLVVPLPAVERALDDLADHLAAIPEVGAEML